MGQAHLVGLPKEGRDLQVEVRLLVRVLDPPQPLLDAQQIPVFTVAAEGTRG